MKNKQPGILFGIFLVLVCIVLTWFITAAEEYYDYTAGAIEQSAQTTAPDKEASKQVLQPAAEKLNTEIKFRNFFLTFPEAKKVELQADFNGWGQTPLLLHPYARGYFEVSVALAAGEYKYVFVVDGKDVLDPNNMDRMDYDGRTVCIKTVK